MAGEALFLLLIVIVGSVTAYFWDWLGERWWIVALLAGLQLVSTVVSPLVRYHVHRWEVTENAAYTQTGVWSIERQIAPLSRIQTVQYGEGAIARLFSLASVTITTASATGDIEIEGLDRAVAEALADELTVKADLEEGDAT